MAKRKPPHITKVLLIEAFLRGERVTTSDGVVERFMTTRVENHVSELREMGVRFIEDQKAKSRYSWYKIYAVEPSPSNLERLQELHDSFISQWESVA